MDNNVLVPHCCFYLPTSSVVSFSPLTLSHCFFFFFFRFSHCLVPPRSLQPMMIYYSIIFSLFLFLFTCAYSLSLKCATHVVASRHPFVSL